MESLKTAIRQALRSKRMEYHKRSHFNPLDADPISTLRAPIVRIEDHNSRVLSCDFHPSGKFLLSSDYKGKIHICDIYGTFEKAMVLKGHRMAVTEAHFSRDGFDVYSCSVDGTLGVWDTFRGNRKSFLEGHTASINSLQVARTGYPILCSGANDSTMRIWDVREKECVLLLSNVSDVTATCFSEDGEHAFAGGEDGIIKIWDLRSRAVVCELSGHSDLITGISLSPCGSYLLSHSKDNTLRVWDVRPYITFKRCVNCFPSNQENAEGLLRCAWSPDGTMISAGTSERDVYIWDALSGETMHELPGHQGTINDVVFHPKESVVLSASDDHYLFLHEMQCEVI